MTVEVEQAMPQLHLYLPKELAAEVKRRAERAGKSVSGYLSEVVRSQVADEWPEGFFDLLVGGWGGEPLVRPPQQRSETRDRVGRISNEVATSRES